MSTTHAVVAPHYAAAEARLAQDPIVVSMAAQLAGGIKAGAVKSSDLFHDDGSPRFELMQRANTQYRSLTEDDTEDRHIGAVANAIVKVWQERGTGA